MSSMTATSATISFETYRPALLGHCYRMLGSVVDAEDAVQEAMLRAWKSHDGFKEQSSLKTWLYRIATNVCLDTLSKANRQRLSPLELSDTPAEVREDMQLRQRPREHWVEPIPDTMTLAADEDRTTAEAYGIWVEKSMYGRKYMGTARVTFVIDEKGKIEDIIEKVDTKDHVSQILKARVANTAKIAVEKKSRK